MSKTAEAKTLTELSAIKEQIELDTIREEIRYMNVEECKERFSKITNKYKDNIGIYREKIIFSGNHKSPGLKCLRAFLLSH